MLVDGVTFASPGIYAVRGSLINLFSGFQAVIKQFGGSGYESSDVIVIDEIEMQRHQQLEKLYRATRSGKVKSSEFISSFFVLLIFNYQEPCYGSSCKDCRISMKKKI